MQKRTAQINADPELQQHNRIRMGYSHDDLELLTRSKGENAYHFAEEWVTDEDAILRDEEKRKKLVCKQMVV
ncbi:9159_t:CDS:2 [Racocetra fulgida]|uniref:9159_t:CDS:1 n=1 Tax=Racocetra fulgida TaxID=60492 RepID=A0A9N9I9N7_9GLOM|nr:9159_t:CDS:2 [Racocetra fulgida]